MFAMFVEGARSPSAGNSWQSRHKDSKPLDMAIHAGGSYVYVVDLAEVVHVVRDGPHRHPEVLGQGANALYAGEIKLDQTGRVTELNNLSGTFKFKSSDGLRCVAQHLIAVGIAFDDQAVVFYDPDGITRPRPMSLNFDDES